MRRKIIISIAVLLAAIMTFLLWPLRSEDFTIVWDEEALREKQEFLANIPLAEPADSLPNILFILVDDLGLYDMSFYGGSDVETPQLDKLARSGVAFDQAYVASPMCSASRASILTGRYPQRFGFEFQMHDRYLKNRLEYYGFKFLIASNIWRPKLMEEVPRQEDIEMQGLPPSEISIAELLKSRGYSTAMIGKWHTGTHAQNLPRNFGFDYQYGFFDAHTLYAPVGTKGITDQQIPNDFTDQYNWSLGREGTRGIYRNYERIKEEEHLTDAITRECIDFIKSEDQKPVFIMAAYNAPHTPLQAPDHYVDMFKNETDPVKRVYFAMIRHLDDAIGHLLDELDKLGKKENTLIVFLSDNGGATYTYTTENGPLRGGKITDFEGGVRVPFFMSWEGKIMSGFKYEKPVMGMDVYTTLAAITSCPLPPGRQIDGKNLLEYIGNDTLLPHHQLYWQRGNCKAIRSGDMKVIWNEEFRDTLLYNISRDPNELQDIYNKPIVLSLIERHRKWSSTMQPPLWPSIVYYREWVDGRWVYFDN